jgi:hypothetical protein
MLGGSWDALSSDDECDAEAIAGASAPVAVDPLTATAGALAEALAGASAPVAVDPLTATLLHRTQDPSRRVALPLTLEESCCKE